MQQKRIRIRTAIPADAEALLEIYGLYIRKTAITFEYEVPGVEEFRERIRKTLENYPYLVAECDGEICGYAYTGAFVGTGSLQLGSGSFHLCEGRNAEDGDWKTAVSDDRGDFQTSEYQKFKCIHCLPGYRG